MADKHREMMPRRREKLPRYFADSPEYKAMSEDAKLGHDLWWNEAERLKGGASKGPYKRTPYNYPTYKEQKKYTSEPVSGTAYSILPNTHQQGNSEQLTPSPIVQHDRHCGRNRTDEWCDHKQRLEFSDDH
jgi:hypothetical protein